MENTIIRDLEALGYQGRTVSIGRLQELREEIEGRHRQGVLDEDLYQEYLARFDRQPPQDMEEARSLIVVAYRDPPVRFTFSWEGETVRLALPPTYLQAKHKDQQVQQALAMLLDQEGCRVAQAAVPKKLLAVRSGMAAYGRNNIAYVKGMGSYHRLVVFYSDRACEEEQWREARLLERCEQCRACLRGCPTGAIDPGRFLLRAERCLTFWNEKPGQVSFPQWVESSWHNCLVGCLYCQRVCPENRDVLDWDEAGAEFSEQETGLLLKESAATDMPATLMEKLKQWDLLQFLDILARNLRACLQSSRSGGTDRASPARCGKP